MSPPCYLLLNISEWCRQSDGARSTSPNKCLSFWEPGQATLRFVGKLSNAESGNTGVLALLERACSSLLRCACFRYASRLTGVPHAMSVDA